MKFKCPYYMKVNELKYLITGCIIKNIEINLECYHCKGKLTLTMDFIKHEDKVEKIKAKNYIG